MGGLAACEQAGASSCWLLAARKAGSPAALPTESLTPVGSIPAESQEEGALMCRESANLDSAQRSYTGPLPLRKGAYCSVNFTLFVQSH